MEPGLNIGIMTAASRRSQTCLEKLLMALLLLAMVVWLVGDSKMKIWDLFEGRGGVSECRVATSLSCAINPGSDYQ